MWKARVTFLRWLKLPIWGQFSKFPLASHLALLCFLLIFGLTQGSPQCAHTSFNQNGFQPECDCGYISLHGWTCMSEFLCLWGYWLWMWIFHCTGIIEYISVFLFMYLCVCIFVTNWVYIGCVSLCVSVTGALHVRYVCMWLRAYVSLELCLYFICMRVCCMWSCCSFGCSFLYLFVFFCISICMCLCSVFASVSACMFVFVPP